VYRISQNGQQPIIDVDGLEDIEPALRSRPPGRYDLDEISADPLQTGRTSRAWGVAVKFPDGSVAIEPDPWDS
jgi:hypothetical protein